jgi:NADP-dependent 3-hydroxy acid dehydrogenase YdfG
VAGTLEGRVALVTGASSGIGEAVARALVAAGACVVLGARRADRLQALAEALGPKAAWRETDVRVRADLEALAELAQTRFGAAADILIANAGVMPASVLADDRVDDWDRMIDVNLKGALYGVHAVLNSMLARGRGDIVFTSSVSAFHVMPASSVYSATKTAVRIIAEGLRQETAGKGVRVITVYPGFVATELAESLTIEAVRERARVNMAKGMSPTLIAEAILGALALPAEVSMNEIVIRPTWSTM